MEETREQTSRGGLPARVEAARGFLEGVRGELKKVTWPTRDELFKATRMIVLLSIVLGFVIGMVDVLLNLILVRGIAALVQ